MDIHGIIMVATPCKGFGRILYASNLGNGQVLYARKQKLWLPVSLYQITEIKVVELFTPKRN